MTMIRVGNSGFIHGLAACIGNAADDSLILRAETVHLVLDKRVYWGVPSACFKQAMITAAKDCVPMRINAESVKLGIRVTAGQQRGNILNEEIVPLKSKLSARTDVISLVGRTARIRTLYRAEFIRWTTELQIRFDGEQFTDQEILGLLARAGQTVGIGEMRPEKGMSHGQWRVLSAKRIPHERSKTTRNLKIPKI